MLSRPWCPDPCVTSDPQHMVGQRSFDKLAASRCRRVTPLSWKSLWRAASSKRRLTPWRHAPGRRIRAVVARLLHWSSRVPCPRSVDSDSSYQSTCRQAFLQMSTSEDERLASRYKLCRTSNDEEDGLQGKIQRCKWDTKCWTFWRRVLSHILSC